MNAVGSFLRAVTGMLVSPSATFGRVLAEDRVSEAGVVLLSIAGLEFLRIVFAHILILYRHGRAEASAIFALSHPMSVLILAGLLLVLLPRVKGKLRYTVDPDFKDLLTMSGFASAPLLLLNLLKFGMPGFGVRVTNVFLPVFFELWYVYLLSIGLGVYLYGRRGSVKFVALCTVFFVIAVFVSGMVAFFFLLATRDALALL